MAEFDSTFISALLAKIVLVNEDQKSIQQCASFVGFHRRRSTLILGLFTAIAQVELTPIPNEKALGKFVGAIFYVMNEVIQSTKKKGPEFVKGGVQWAAAMADLLTMPRQARLVSSTNTDHPSDSAVSHSSLSDAFALLRRRLLRLLQVWTERVIYPPALTSALVGMMQGATDEDVASHRATVWQLLLKDDRVIDGSGSPLAVDMQRIADQCMPLYRDEWRDKVVLRPKAPPSAAAPTPAAAPSSDGPQASTTSAATSASAAGVSADNIPLVLRAEGARLLAKRRPLTVQVREASDGARDLLMALSTVRAPSAADAREALPAIDEAAAQASAAAAAVEEFVEDVRSLRATLTSTIQSCDEELRRASGWQHTLRAQTAGLTEVRQRASHAIATGAVAAPGETSNVDMLAVTRKRKADSAATSEGTPGGDNEVVVAGGWTPLPSYATV